MSQVGAFRTVQVSFLGRVSLNKDGGRDDRPLYRQATYQFDDGQGLFEIKTAIFPLALGKYLEDRGRRADCLLLVGTRQSNWDALIDLLEGVELDESRWAEVRAWSRAVMSKASDVDELSVDEALLQKLPVPIRDALPYHEVRLQVVPNGCNDAEQRMFMKAILQHLEPSDQVILDVTHALRHMPVLAAFLLIALRWLRNVTVQDMFYGALELTEKNKEAPSPPKREQEAFVPVGNTPVINVRLAAEYANLGAAMATYATTGSYRALAEHFPEQAARMVRADFLENIHRLADAHGDALSLHQQFTGWNDPDNDPYRTAVADVVKKEWAWAALNTPEQHMLAQAVRSLGHGEYFKCASILQETVYTYVERFQLLHPATKTVAPITAEEETPHHRTEPQCPECAKRAAKEKKEKLEKAQLNFTNTKAYLKPRLKKLGATTTEQRNHYYQVLKDLGILRNCMVHTRPSVRPGEEEAFNRIAHALQSRIAMERLLKKGITLARWVLDEDARDLPKFEDEPVLLV